MLFAYLFYLFFFINSFSFAFTKRWLFFCFFLAFLCFLNDLFFCLVCCCCFLCFFSWLKRVLIYSSIRISLCVLHFATGATSKPKNEAYFKALERLQQVLYFFCRKVRCETRLARVSHKEAKAELFFFGFLKTELTAGFQSVSGEFFNRKVYNNEKFFVFFFEFIE